MDGAAACKGGTPTTDELMNHKAYAKVFHRGSFKKNGLDYMQHAEGKGWTRVKCAGGLSYPETDYSWAGCFKKERMRVRYHFRDYDGTAIDVDLLELMTEEQVIEQAREP